MTEYARRQRPLRVLEIGVDRGQMKAFVDGAPRSSDTPLYTSWDTADVSPQKAALEAAGYENCIDLNLDDMGSIANFVSERRGQYDAIVVLHVLEHLTQPERAVTFLAAALNHDGVMIGGFPVVPSGIARLRERQLRRSAKPFGHVSAFSPRRVNKMAERSGLTVDYASGAFAVRASGSMLENQSWWLRANVAFGAAFRGWPGEIYWQFRRPAAAQSRPPEQ
jgi:SAM-dependent methyltransferase